MLLAKDQALVCPGDKLSEVDDALPGNGTHIFEGFIVSSLLGRLKYAYASLSAGPIQQQNEGETKAATTSTSKPTLSVTIEGRGIEGGEASAPPIPLALAIGDEVLAKVRSLNPRYASATIVCKETIPLVKEFSGIIRVQDVRSSEIDKVNILTSFRPGDIVRAEVISLGESQSLLLSTAKVHLGVLHAKSEAGHAMVPVSWSEMQCPITKTKGQRKVAKP